jgi:hypothetical protein
MYEARSTPLDSTERTPAVSYPELLDPNEKLTDAKRRLDIPRVVVLCGSTRFMQEMTDADRELTWAGDIVIKPGCDMKTPDPLWADPAEAEAGKARLDGLHRAKIRLADAVYVICPGGYIGDSTSAEIEYARSLGLPITYITGKSASGPLTTLASRLRELHYEVDGSPDREGSCLADGCDWPCPTIRALDDAQAAAGEQ